MILLLMLACDGTANLEISPSALSWGEVDFHNADPDECDGDEGGCDPQVLRITNGGSAEVEVSLPNGYDREHICISGWESGDPIDLGVLASGSSYELLVSVCGYLPGELTTEVSGAFGVSAGEDTVDVPWAFTPVRDIPVDDTGD